MSKTRSSSHENSNTPAIVGGTIGSAAAICAVIGIVGFLRRRQRSNLSDSMKIAQGIVTPYNPISSDASTEPLVSEDPEAGLIALRGPSSTPPTELPLSRPVAPIPAGLSGKELARIRRDALSSQQSHNSLTPNASQFTSPPITAARATSSSYDPRRLHTEVESLRREMERLRTEGLAIEAPPSYR